MDRLTPKNLQDFTDAQRKLYDAFTKTRKPKAEGQVGGPFDAWMLNADMGRRISGLGNLYRFETNVDRRYVELVILVTGQFWQAQFEWFAHEPMAVEAGVPQAVIDAIKAGETPPFDHQPDEAAWRLASELHNTHQVSDTTYQLALDAFDEVGIAELINLAGFYTMVSMTLNTFRVSLPEGATYPFPIHE